MNFSPDVLHWLTIVGFIAMFTGIGITLMTRRDPWNRIGSFITFLSALLLIMTINATEANRAKQNSGVRAGVFSFTRLRGG